jgi:soluble lytic murein transglycosylase-like protein
MGIEPPVQFPDDWKTPGATVQKAIDEAAKEYGIDAEILYGIGRRETGFIVNSVGKANGTNSKSYANSYADKKDQKIPGSSMTWGEMFPTSESWRAIGFMQLNPYHLVGRGKPLKAGATLAQMQSPRVQARAAAALLVTLFKKANGDWTKALLLYNGSKSYRRDVAQNMIELRQVNGVA